MRIELEIHDARYRLVVRDLFSADLNSISSHVSLWVISISLVRSKDQNGGLWHCGLVPKTMRVSSGLDLRKFIELRARGLLTVGCISPLAHFIRDFIGV